MFDGSEVSCVPRRGAADDDDDDDVATGSLGGDGSSCVQAATAGMIPLGAATPRKTVCSACSGVSGSASVPLCLTSEDSKENDVCKIAQRSSNPGKAQRRI